MLDAHDLPNDVDHLKRLVLEHRSRVQAQQLEIERLKIQPSRLRRWKFGRSSEQLDLQIAQIELTLQVLQAVTPPVTTTVAEPAANHNVSAIREHRPPARRALPAHLPRETVMHVSPSVRNGCTCAVWREASQARPGCGGDAGVGGGLLQGDPARTREALVRELRWDRASPQRRRDLSSAVYPARDC